MRSLLAGAALTVALCGGAAHASWYQASSKHFIIYADENPNNLRDFAGRLERFDAGVRYVKQMDDPDVGDGNRLAIFVLPKTADVQALIHDSSNSLAGFYTGRVSGSLAYIGKDSTSGDDKDLSILFHEYTHHLMRQDLQRPYPEWYVEGFAEFFSTPKFESDGSIWFGRPLEGRAWSILNGPKVPLDTLLTGMKPNMSAEEFDIFYGRAWLLTHYLLMDSARDGQLNTYVVSLTRGASPAEAARQAFGNVKQLDRELDSYRNKRMLSFKITPDKMQVEGVNVTPLGAGAAQVMIARAKIKYEEGQPAEALAAQVRAIQGNFPGDEMVERTLAEAELNAGHAAAAQAAAERALKLNPTSTEALALKGRAIVELADATTDRAAAHALFDQARAAFSSANKLDVNDPEPLYEFYMAFTREGQRPTANAIEALHYSSDLAPQDLGLRMNSAIAFLNEGKPAEARATLAVVAYSPHASTAGAVAKRLIAEIDAGRGKDALMILRNDPSMRQSAH